MLISLLASALLSWGAPAASTPAEALFLASAAQPTDVAQADPWGWEYDRQAHRNVRARLWVDNDRDFYRSGDRLRVRFSTSEDAHVALIHVDPDGRLEFLFPASPWDSDRVRGGRSYSLPRNYQAGVPIANRPGIGYIYLIASPVPLDYRNFSRNRGGPWDWSYAGRMVTGDPFWAMEQISRLLVPGYAPYASDYFSYYVGGRHSYPSYACADNFRGTRGGWGWSSSYGPCSRLDLFLRQHPYYYDARRYRGDRRAYLARTYGPPPVEHRFKEPAVGASPNARVAEPPRRGASEPVRRDANRNATTPAQRPPPARQPARGAQGAAERREEAPERTRPTLERRTPAGQGATRQATPAPAAQPQRNPPASNRPQPRREEARGSGGQQGSQSRGSSPARAPAANRGNQRGNDTPAARSGESRESSTSGAARNRRPPGDET